MQILSTSAFERKPVVARSNLMPDGASAGLSGANAWHISVPPNASTSLHNHHESELWIVVSGTGAVEIDGVGRTVRSGDTIHLPPTARHRVTNLSSTEHLNFVSCWWNDPRELQAAVTRNNRERGGYPQRLVLLPAFPTPNGDLHLGHISGPYLGADIYRRCAELHGCQTDVLLGTIGHMNHVSLAARQRAETYYQTAEYFTDEIAATLKRYSIGYDTYVRPTPTPEYTSTLTDVFHKLSAKGYVKKRAAPAQYCCHCETFCFEAEVSGICPFCASTSASGNDCEGCARPHEDAALQAPVCRYCGHATTLRECERYFLDLEPQRELLLASLDKAFMPARLRRFADWVLADRLPTIAISHFADFGVLVPGEPPEGQRIASTFEHAARLLEALRQLAELRGEDARETVRAMARGDGSVELVALFGWDNAFMRVVLFPVLLHAYLDGDIVLKGLLTNEFLNLEGSKFSTSRNHAIWGRDMDAPVDASRLYLSSIRAETAVSDYRRGDFDRFLDEQFAGTIGAWMTRVHELLAVSHGSVVPEGGPWDPTCSHYYAAVSRFHDEARYASSYRGFSPRHLADACLRFAQTSDNFTFEIQALIAQKGGAPRLADSYGALALMGLRSFCVFAYPLMPSLCGALGDALGLPENWTRGAVGLDAPDYVAPRRSLGSLKDLLQHAS